MNWININKRLPKTYKQVLVFTESEIQAVALLFKKKSKTRKVNKFMVMIGSSKDTVIEDVTHWMELPSPPKFDS